MAFYPLKSSNPVVVSPDVALLMCAQFILFATVMLTASVGTANYLICCVVTCNPILCTYVYIQLNHNFIALTKGV